MTTRDVLVFSTDPMAAALLGAAVELAGYETAFPNAGESARDALLRTRPRTVLVDCDHEGACTEEFFGPAMMMNAAVAIFSSSRSRRTLAPIAAQFGVSTFTLPIELDDLTALLERCCRAPSP